MTAPAISVVIPTYNRESLITRAVLSALRSVTPRDEVIVVDDGSTDGTEKVLQPLMARIRYVRTENRGAGPARNRGVREARHPLVALLDSDDEFLPDKLTLQRTLMAARPDLVMSFSDFVVRDGTGRERHNFLVHWHEDRRSWNDILGRAVRYSTLGPLPEGREDFDVHIGDLYPAMLTACYVATFTTVIRVEAAGADLYAPEDLAFYEDWECFARLTRRGPVAYLACETARNWGHDGARLSQTREVLKATSQLTVLNRLWGADPAFLAGHQARFQQTVAKAHLIRARHLIAEGRTREARADLAAAGETPISYRTLSWLPGSVARRIMTLRN